MTSLGYDEIEHKSLEYLRLTLFVARLCLNKKWCRGTKSLLRGLAIWLRKSVLVEVSRVSKRFSISGGIYMKGEILVHYLNENHVRVNKGKY